MSFSPTGWVVLVDDDAVVRAAITQSFELAGLTVRAFTGAADALAAIDANFNGMIVSDIRMPEIDGLQFFQLVRDIDPSIPFVLITGHGDIPMAVAALRDGVDDFIPKPFASAHLIASVQRGLARRRLELDNRLLRSMVEQAAAANSVFLGGAPAIVRLRETVEQIAGMDLDVLIEGEPGVGKELVALLLHRAGKRRGQPFVSVSSSTLSADSATRYLFGDDASLRGTTARTGQVARAHRGTLFIDNIAQLDSGAQQRILSLLEDREFTPEGADQPTHIDLRLVAGAPPGVDALVAQGRVRSDLYHALNVVRLRIPPLRERRDDIPLLFAHFVDEAATQLRCQPGPLTDAMRRHLIDHDWPGNVRELKSFAFRSATGIADIEGAGENEATRPLPARVDHFEAAAIRAVLGETNGSAAEAVRRLGIPRKTFYDKLHRHNIDIDEYRK